MFEVFTDSKCEASLRVSVTCNGDIEKRTRIIGCIRYIKGWLMLLQITFMTSSTFIFTVFCTDLLLYIEDRRKKTK